MAAAAALTTTVRAAREHLPADASWPFALVGGLAELGEALTAPLFAALDELSLTRLPTPGSALDGARCLTTPAAKLYGDAVLHAQADEPTDTLDLLTTEAVRPGLEDLDQRTPAAIVFLALKADVRASNAKLRRRVLRSVCEVASCTEDAAWGGPGGGRFPGQAAFGHAVGRRRCCRGRAPARHRGRPHPHRHPTPKSGIRSHHAIAGSARHPCLSGRHRRNRVRLSRRQGDARAYFVGEGDLPWWPICFSIVATKTSTLTVISVPGVAYLNAFGFVELAIGYIIGRSLVAGFLLPLYMREGFVSCYQYLRERFGPGLQIVVSVTFLVTRLLAEGVRLFASAIPIKLLLDAIGLTVV